MAQAARRAALPDTAEQQVAVDYNEDPNFTWHHRILQIRIGDSAQYVCTTPDWETEILDLSQHRVVHLPRGGAAPARVAGDF